MSAGAPAPGGSVLVRTLAAAPDLQLVRRLLEPPCDATGDPAADEHLAAVFALLVAARLSPDPMRARLELLWAAADEMGRQALAAALSGANRDDEYADRCREVQMTLNRWATEIGGAGVETVADGQLLGTSLRRPGDVLATDLGVTKLAPPS